MAHPSLGFYGHACPSGLKIGCRLRVVFPLLLCIRVVSLPCCGAPLGGMLLYCPSGLKLVVVSALYSSSFGFCVRVVSCHVVLFPLGYVVFACCRTFVAHLWSMLFVPNDVGLLLFVAPLGGMLFLPAVGLLLPNFGACCMCLPM